MADVSDKPEGPGADESLPGVVRGLHQLDRIVGIAEQAGLAVFLMVLIVLGGYQAVVRNFFDYSPPWSFEVLRNAVFFIAMFGAALAAHTDQMIGMDIVARLVRPRARLIIKLTTGLFTIGVCLFFAYAAMEFREPLKDEKDYFFISAATSALALPVGLVLIAFHVAVRAVEQIAHLARGTLPREEAPKAH